MSDRISNADPVELEFWIDSFTGRMGLVIAKMREAMVYTPSEIPEQTPHRWPRVVRRWEAKHLKPT